MNYFVKQIVKRGYEISKPGITDRPSVMYRKIFSRFKIDHLLDVGANEGQFAGSMRKLGYAGKLSSFEPQSAVFQKLKENASGDPQWETFNMGLGKEDGSQEINISKNTVSSSLLEMLPDHVKQEPDSAFVGKERIEVRKLDSILGKEKGPGASDSIFLKLDVQGYEKFVMEGAAGSFRNIKVIQLEMALIPLYKGELLLGDMILYMDRLGYKLYNLVNGFNNFDTGQLFQVDGIFVRADLIN